MVNYTLDSSSNIVPVSLTDERKGGCEADFSHLLFYKLNQKHWLVIDTFNDVVEIVDNKTKSDVFDCADTTNQYWNYYCIRCSKNKEKLEKLHADILQQAEKEKFNFFVICPTYNCNSRCVYCYQQYNPLLDRRSISLESLAEMLSYVQTQIDEIKSKYPEQFTALGLFGGEPFIKKNKPIVEKVMEFARLNKVSVLPTTNLQEIEEFIDIFIKYRGYFGRICTTIDGDKDYHNSRRKSLITKDSFAKVVSNVNLLLKLQIPVTVTINIDKSNKHKLHNFLQLAKENNWCNNPLVNLEIGRVDDRCYTGTSDDIMSEAELLKYLRDFNEKEAFPNNIKLAFVKTSLALAQHFGFDFNQNERGRKRFHYCWSGTPVDNVQYIDKNLRVFRCTYTVGRDDLALAELKKGEMSANVEMYNRSSFLDKCWNCPLGGYCGGGCSVSTHVDQSRFCQEEQKNFEYLVQEVILPIVWSKFNGVSE